MADVEPITPLFDHTTTHLKKSASFVAKSALDPKKTTSKPWTQPIASCSVETLIKHRVTNLAPVDIECQDAFYVADLGEIARQHLQFRTLLPRVEPFYAVKCNPDPMVIKALIKLGTGFDCASRTEIQMVMDQGVRPEQIIYANPCKQASHIKHAESHGVRMMTFDNKDELFKIKTYCPDAQLVLRILTDDSKSLCKLGTKFGATLERVPELLGDAKALELDVIGISFHVGSGCYDAQAFGDAVTRARKAFDIGKSLGFNFTLLDVGGGFPGRVAEGVQFTDIARILSSALDTHFPLTPTLRIIAEPGRYYVSSTYTLVVNIVARREIPPSLESPDTQYLYYVNDGMYGSFNCITFDHATVKARPLLKSNEWVFGKTETHYSTGPWASCNIFGPTCDSIDCIGKGVQLPVMQVGDYMYFENMGAYTMCAASEFNGFKKSIVVYTTTEVGLEVLLGA